MKKKNGQRRFGPTLGEKVNRVHQYVADMKAAHDAWENGDQRRMDQLLTAHIPQDGQEDIRGFEWRLLWGLAHSPCKILTGHEGDVYCVTYSPDGKTVATASKDRTVRLWDAETAKELSALAGHTDEVSSVSFSPNGKMLASSGDDATIRIWDVETRKTIRVLKRPGNQAVVGVEFCPDGETLASGDAGGQIVLWDVKSWSIRETIQAHADRIECISFSLEGKLLASCSRDGTVRLWDVDSANSKATASGKRVSALL